MAFLMGVVSACSLPLGALSSRFWKPGDRALAFLMAFGGGALLAALTIDLVAPAVENGHIWPLGAGCILGGLLFVILNQVVNNHGGFLRKSSTTIYYLRLQRQRRFRRILSEMGNMPVFRDLPTQEAERLVESVITREYPADSTLYHKNDPSERLYIVDEGAVELLDPLNDMRPFRKLGRNDAFGRMAFLTGAPHKTVAVTREETRVWIVTRQAFNDCLGCSPRLSTSLQAFLGSDEIRTYLQERHGFDEAGAKAWMHAAVENIRGGGTVESAVPIERRGNEFIQRAGRIRRVPIFEDMTEEDLRDLASRVFYKHHSEGHMFFHQGEYADRMYVIEHGKVSLIDSARRARAPVVLQDQDAFGALSFLTGSHHAVSAVAATDIGVWVLRRRDFVDLLQKSRRFSHAVREFLQREDVHEYLEDRHALGHDRADLWRRRAARKLEAGEFAPSAAEMAEIMTEQKAAPVAIWLGILLDGVPESLVIGASMIHSHVSLSLLGGLFLSNYPEALSSSVGMKQQGFSFKRIFLMWTSLMLVTGLGSAMGNLFLAGTNASVFALVQGVAAGAMLTMIAETMLPEAYFKGGSIIGMSTLLGFLAAIFFQCFTPGG
jgi:CRP-like cAMP-binding protein